MTAEPKPSLKGILGSKPENEEPETDFEGGKAAAAQSVIDAVKSGDASALATALSDFVELCS